ncbi:MAG: UbiX family flavin prenyltransferase [bacterium]|nr:UbiX family flavin prenyltransferase [bacterium]
MNQTDKIGLAITGASGVIIGLRVLEELTARQITVHLTISPNAVQVARLEQGVEIDIESGRIEGLGENRYEWIVYHHFSHVGAAPASGSYDLRAVIIAPCSMGTMGRLASGTSENLIGRMGDVALKERRPLILVPRETPYSTIQLQNMLTLSQVGAIILPASPGFYHRPQSVSDMVDFIVQRVLQHVGVEAKTLIGGGWGELTPVAAQKRMS